MPNARIERAAPLSDLQIREVEQALGRKLPIDYQVFLKEYGGAFVGGFVDSSDGLPVLQFFGVKENLSILDVLELHPDLKSQKVLPIADCEFGNPYVLDSDDSIHYIDYYVEEKASTKIASNFQDFLDRIVIVDD